MSTSASFNECPFKFDISSRPTRRFSAPPPLETITPESKSKLRRTRSNDDNKENEKVSVPSESSLLLRIRSLQTDLDNALEDVAEYRLDNDSLREDTRELQDAFEKQSKKLVDVCREKRDLVSKLEELAAAQRASAIEAKRSAAAAQRALSAQLQGDGGTEDSAGMVWAKERHSKLLQKCESYGRLIEEFCLNSNAVSESLDGSLSVERALGEWQSLLQLKEAQLSDACEKRRAVAAEVSDSHTVSDLHSEKQQLVACFCRSIVDRCIDDARFQASRKQWVEAESVLCDAVSRAMGQRTLICRQSEELASLRSAVSEERMRNASLSQECAKLRLISATECGFLESDIDALKSETQTAAAQKRSLEQSVLSMSSLVASLRIDLAKANDSAKALKRELRASVEQCSLKESQLQESSSRLLRSAAQLKECSHELAKSESRTQLLHLSAAKSQATMQALATENEELQRKQRQLHSDYVALCSSREQESGSGQLLAGGSAEDGALRQMTEALQLENEVLREEVEKGRRTRTELREFLKSHHSEAQQKLDKAHTKFLFMRKLTLTTYKALLSEQRHVNENALLRKQLTFLVQELENYNDCTPMRATASASRS